MTGPLTALESAFDALKRDLIRPEGPQISTMRNYRYAILAYQPEDEFRQRELAQRLVTDLTGGGFVVQTLSLQSLFMQCLDDVGEDALSRVAELERQIAARSPERGLTHLKGKLEVWLNHEDTGIAARVSRELDRYAAAHPDKVDRTLVLVGRAGALYPFFRVSTLLKRLENNARLPVVLLYPGERRGPTGLSFMGELVPEGDYRPRIYS